MEMAFFSHCAHCTCRRRCASCTSDRSGICPSLSCRHFQRHSSSWHLARNSTSLSLPSSCQRRCALSHSAAISISRCTRCGCRLTCIPSAFEVIGQSSTVLPRSILASLLVCGSSKRHETCSEACLHTSTCHRSASYTLLAGARSDRGRTRQGSSSCREQTRTFIHCRLILSHGWLPPISVRCLDSTPPSLRLPPPSAF